MNPRSRRKLDPYNEKDRPEPIEILARMAGRTNFITPKATASSTSTVPVTPLDIAHAIATAQDKFGATMAMAIACQRPQEYEKAEALGLPRVLSHLRAQRTLPGVVNGDFRFRARIAFRDAFEYLLVPPLRPNWTIAARRWRMRREVYKFIVKQATGVLDGAANTAAKDAVDFLFRHHLERFTKSGRNAAVILLGGEIRIFHGPKREDALGDFLAANGPVPVYELQDLMEDVLARPRSLGLLSLNNSRPTP